MFSCIYICLFFLTPYFSKSYAQRLSPQKIVKFKRPSLVSLSVFIVSSSLVHGTEVRNGQITWFRLLSRHHWAYCDNERSQERSPFSCFQGYNFGNQIFYLSGRKFKHCKSHQFNGDCINRRLQMKSVKENRLLLLSPWNNQLPGRMNNSTIALNEKCVVTIPEDLDWLFDAEKSKVGKGLTFVSVAGS